MAFDAYLSGVADLFLQSLTPEERQDCRNTILNRLCMEVSLEDPLDDPPVFPNNPGVYERTVGDWHFRYLIRNAATLEIATIYYRPGHPKYPEIVL